MKLLEVIRTPQTSDDTFNAMVAWGKAMKKTTVAAKDTPGKSFDLVSTRVLLTCVVSSSRIYCQPFTRAQPHGSDSTD